MLPPGQIARRLLGRHFETVGNVYRRFFVDLERVADVFAQELPRNAKILDIGGGDGALIERIIAMRPDLSVTMCDLAPSIGAFMSNASRAKVVLLPSTDFADISGSFDAVTVSDVLHHVPIDVRDSFFASLAWHCGRWGCRKVILKDIEPSGIRAKLALFTDRYVTGDKHVVPFPRASFAEFAQRYFSQATMKSAIPDWPNYCEVLSWSRDCRPGRGEVSCVTSPNVRGSI